MHSTSRLTQLNHFRLLRRKPGKPAQTQFRNFALILGLFLAVGPFTGCLKSRVQVREDASPADEAPVGQKPVSMTPQEVPTQGQYALDELKGEVTRLTGRIEDLERQLQQKENQASATSQGEQKKLMDRIIELEQAQAAMLIEIKKLQNAPSATQNVNSEEVFNTAKTHFAAKEYDSAIVGFTQYLSMKKILKAEAATFFRAEAYFANKDYKKAIADYSKFQEKYIHSPKNVVALYKIGLSFEALNMSEEAKTFYQELIDKFPKSAEAKLARKKIR